MHFGERGLFKTTCFYSYHRILDIETLKINLSEIMISVRHSIYIVFSL